MEHLVVPTFVLDPQQRVLIWNRACERLTGISASDVVGTQNHWQAFYESPRPCLADLVATGDWESIGKLYTTHEEATTPAHGVHAENWCAMPRLGRNLYLAVDAGPVFDDTGKLVAVVETLRDITDKKLAEAKIQEQADILQQHLDKHHREGELARTVLEHQIRVDLLRQSGVDCAVLPATRFSGDIVLAARAPNGKLYSILADATGHGLAAAVTVLPIVSEFYRLVEQSVSVTDLAGSINLLLGNALPIGRFVAAAITCVDSATRCGEVWVGGTPTVLLLGSNNEVVRHFDPRQLPLGVCKESLDCGAVETFTWDSPCQLLLCSDGVVEALSPQGEQFGGERLISSVTRCDGRRIIDCLQDDLRAHLV